MNKEIEERLDDFIDDILNSDDDVDIKECYSYKSLVKDLKVLEILKKYIVALCNSKGKVVELDINNKEITKRDAKKLKEWLDNDK